MEEIIRQIRAIARRYPPIDRILLFGSRARGDHRPKSDVDIAVFASAMPASDWREFCDAIHGSIRTLLEFDIVRVDDCTESFFLHNITTDGVVIYEKVGD